MLNKPKDKKSRKPHWLKINLPFDWFHCICKSYGRLLFPIPFKGWLVLYRGDCNKGKPHIQIMEHTPSQPKWKFHNCRITGVY